MPASGCASSGVAAETFPTFEPGAHAVGSAWKVASGHALLSVERRAASCEGSFTDTDLVFASPATCARLTVRPAGAPRLAARDVAVIFGAYGSASQPVAWNGLERSCVAPSVDVSVAPTAS